VERLNGEPLVWKPLGSNSAGEFQTQVQFNLRNGPAARISVYHFSAESEIAETWYLAGCAGIAVQPRIVAERPGPQPVRMRLAGFQPNVPVRLTTADGIRIRPAQVTPANGRPFEVQATLDPQPRCETPTPITATQHNVDPDVYVPPEVEFAPSAFEEAPLVVAPAALALAPEPPPRQATAQIHVICPRFSATPTTFADSALPGSTRVTGTDWYPGLPVTLTLDGKQLTSITLGRGDRDFNQDVKLPRLNCGQHKLAAGQVADVGGEKRVAQLAPEDTLVLRKEVTITVTCTPAFLAVEPAVTPAGMTTTAAGAGFVAGRTIKLDWVDLNGRSLGEAGTAEVSGGGTFLVTCLVMPNSELGTRRLRAVEVPAAGDPVTARSGQADLLVVPSAMERGRHRFVERG